MRYGKILRGRREKMKQDNRGLTLIELIIAITVTSIILGAIILFMQSAVRSYETATNTIDLQMESHVMMEQLGAWIMEGNRIEVVERADVSTDAGLTIDSDVLAIYRIPRTSDVGHLPDNIKRDTDGKLVSVTDSDVDFVPTASLRLIWIQNGGLYMVEQSIVDYDSYTVTDLPAVTNAENCVCLYMDTFEPKWDEDLNTVKVAVSLKEGKQEYSLKNEFKVRNEIVSAPSPSPSTEP